LLAKETQGPGGLNDKGKRGRGRNGLKKSFQIQGCVGSNLGLIIKKKQCIEKAGLG